MKKQMKRFIALGLTISLGSVPMLSEVSRAKELGVKQDFLLSSEGLNDTLHNLEIDRLSRENFVLSILEQPIIDSQLEGLEDFLEQQQAMQEYAEEYLQDIKPELIGLNESAIFVAEYMSAYNDYFVSEIQKVQEKKISEDEARQNIEAGLQQIQVIVEGETRTVEQSQERVKDFDIDFEKDYKELEASVTKAEEILIEQGDLTEEEVREMNEALAEWYSDQDNQNKENLRVGTTFLDNNDSVEKIGLLIRGIRIGITKSSQAMIGRPIMFAVTRNNVTKLLMIHRSNLSTIVRHPLRSSRAEWKEIVSYQRLTSGVARPPAPAMKTSTSFSFDSLLNKWIELRKDVQTMIDKVASGEDLITIKSNFEEASVSWGNTQDIVNAYQQFETNISDETIEINLDDIDTEEELEEVLKEDYGVDALIETSELTDEELEKFLLDLVEEELDEVA